MMFFDRARISRFISCILAGLLLAPTASVAQPILEDYGQLSAYSNPAMSPSGERIASVVVMQKGRSLLVLDGQTPIKSILIKENLKLRGLHWATDDIILMDFSQTVPLRGFEARQAEFRSTMVIPLNAEPWVIFDRQRDVANANFGFFGVRIIDGVPYGYFSGLPLRMQPGNNGSARNGGYAWEGDGQALYRVNLTDQSAKKMAVDSRYGESKVWLIDSAGEVSVTLNYVDQTGAWKIYKADGNVLAEGSNPQGGVKLFGFDQTGQNLIYALEDEDTASTQYRSVPVAGGISSAYLEDEGVMRLIIDPRTDHVIGYVESGGDNAWAFFDDDTNSAAAKIRRAFPKRMRQIADWNADFSKILLYTSGSADSGTFWNVDLEQSKVEPLGYERPNIYPEDVGPVSTIRYTAADGLEIEGVLTLPPGRESKNLPVILLPHGGPTSRDDAAFDWWAQAFAARGYAVLQPNFRGSTGRGAAFVRAGYGEWGRKMQSDISEGLAFLVQQGIADGKRACIMGASYGGYASLAGVTLQNGIYRCAVSVNGVADLQMMRNQDVRESGDSRTLQRVFAREVGSGQELRDVSPALRAGNANAPVLLIHGKDDTVVPYRQSQAMADALKDAGKTFEFVTLEGEDHWLSRGDTRLAMLRVAVAFIDKYNPADPAPAKPPTP